MMASVAKIEEDKESRSEGGGKSNSSSSSESSSTEEEERLRRLFQACDRDGDGFIDSHDLMFMCQQLNMEEAVEEIMAQLGADEQGRISFHEFVRCRMRLVNEIEHEKMREQGLLDLSGRLPRAVLTDDPRLIPGSSDNSLGLPPSSVDYDSGARDLSPEPASLYKLLETHEPDLIHQVMEAVEEVERRGAPNVLELANSLHLAALTSLKGEIIDLSNRLQHLTAEKEHLQKQLNKQQTEKLRFHRDAEDRLEQQTVRYEERITELHSVIAELRKKIDRHQISVIREEDEYEESDCIQSNRSNETASLNENNVDESQSTSIADFGNDLNAELSRVVSELEDAIEERKSVPAQCQNEIKTPALANKHQSTLDREAAEVCRELENLCLTQQQQDQQQQQQQQQVDSPQCSAAYYDEQIKQLKRDNELYKDQVGRQEGELNRLRADLGSKREERDRFKRRVRELQTRVQSLEAVSPTNSRTSTPTKSSTPYLTADSSKGAYSAGGLQLPVAKIAELKKLKTGGSTDRQVLGAEISSAGLPHGQVAEHLVQTLQECSNVQEIIQTVYQCGNEISESKVREFEVEVERLQSKIDNLKSQNDLLDLTLEESKAHCNRLSILIGKYESNCTALQLAVSYSDRVLDACEVLLRLLESEQAVILGNCRVAGVGSLGDQGFSDQDEAAAKLQNAHLARRSAEQVAKQLLHRLDRTCALTGASNSPWEDLSSNSRTGSTTSSTGSSGDTEFSKLDEQRLRDYIKQLKDERNAVKLTVMELESVHIDPLGYEPSRNPDSEKLDLENAVLMQELMAMKEEKAELKAKNYLLEKEKSAIELQLSGKQSQEQAYLVHIEHLKSETKELQDRIHKDYSSSGSVSGSKLENVERGTPAITLAELRSCDGTSQGMQHELLEALKREKRLKYRVQELMLTLDKLSKNSEVRHQQSAEFVNDLKRANCALVSAFEKAKKKYQMKLKKLETQLQAVSQTYESQVQMLQQQIVVLEHQVARPVTSETSL